MVIGGNWKETHTLNLGEDVWNRLGQSPSVLPHLHVVQTGLSKERLTGRAAKPTLADWFGQLGQSLFTMELQLNRNSYRLGGRPATQAPRLPLGNQDGTRKNGYWNSTDKKKKTGGFSSIRNQKGKYNELRVGTVNIRGINGKEVELAKEMEKFKLNFVGITETKKQASGESNLNSRYSMIHSGIRAGHARAGVALAFDSSMAPRLIKWEPVNERILWAAFKLSNVHLKLVVAYGPVEGSSHEEVDNFFEDLDRVVKTTHREKVVIIGDLNGRVGNDNKGIEDIMGKFGEDCPANSNGKKLIDLCLGNDLIITNTIFRHKNIHKFTWHENARNRKSIIDYVIAEKSLRNVVRDTRVFRGFEIGSDHFLVVSTINMNWQEIKKPFQVVRRIRVDRLNDLAVRQEFQRKVTEGFVKIETAPRESVEVEWNKYKNCLLEAAKKSCGEVVCKDRKVRTPWWTEKVSRSVKDKKKAYRRFLSCKSQANLEAYKRACQRAKQCVKEAKVKSWEDFGHYVEENFQNGQKIFWGLVKRLRTGGKTSASSLLDRNGELLTSLEDVLDRWNEYFDELLNDSQIASTHGGSGREVHDDNGRWMTIAVHEVRDAISSLKSGKAAGCDEIKPEMVKHSGITGVMWLHRVIQIAWETSSIPADWQKSVIVPVYKKGNKKDCSNYRGISLLSVPCKVYTSILSRKLGKVVENQLSEEQCGFRSGRGCQDNIFVLRQLCEKFHEVNQDLHMAFVDFEKAFDRVPRNKLFNVLESYGVCGKLLSSIESLYSKSLAAVRIDGCTGKWFEINSGVRQGCKLSPLLFVIYMDKIVKESSFAADVALGNSGISSLLYADDLVLISKDVKCLQYNLDQLCKTGEKYGMRINVDKTKIMALGRKSKVIECGVQGKALEQVSDFNYLGAIINESGKLDSELGNRISKAGKVSCQLYKTIFSKKEVSLKTKLAVYNAVFRPTLFYGSESWVRSKGLVRRLEVADMRVLRGISGKNRWVQWQNRISNADIRSELGTSTVGDKIDENILRWFGHVCRMGEERLPHQMLNSKVSGQRPRGRPRVRWIDGVKLAINSRDSSFQKARELAMDRKNWRKFIMKKT